MDRFGRAATLHLIGGAPRSGTTLLQAVLSAAPEASPLLGECPFLCSLLDFYTEVTASWQDDSRYYFASPDAAVEVARAAVSSIFEPLAGRHGNAAVVTKSPGLSLRAAAIRAVLPEARCYAILRDACDVIALQMSASIREIRMGYPPTMLAPGTVAGDSDEEEIWHSGAVVDALADRFLSYYDETVLSTWHLVSYEALVTSPRLSIDRLRAASGLDLEFDPTEEWHGVEFDYLRGSRTAESAWRSDLWGQPVNTSRVGYHRRTLPAAQVQRIERRCGGYLARWRSLTRASDPRPATTVLEDQAR